jgi:hypothetical protein
VEDVQRELLGGLAIDHDAHDQRVDGAMGPLVQRMQRELVAAGNAADERDPLLLGDRWGCLAGIEHVTEGTRRRLGSVIGCV